MGNPQVLVLGSNLLLSLDSTILLEQRKLPSPDSKCFSFDARVNCYARGEGIAALLKPLHNAPQDRDTIQTVPSAESQEALIRRVYAQAALGFEDTRYVEAHGMGTSLGYLTEMSTIGNGFRGPVKANIGHLEGVSGVAGIIKAILALKKGVIPPTTLFATNLPEHEVPAYLEELDLGSLKGAIRVACVNSFTNATLLGPSEAIDLLKVDLDQRGRYDAYKRAWLLANMKTQIDESSNLYRSKASTEQWMM
ncbi:hypothetical protein EAF00_007032 [Botryotinia globosa]|nr:hypothetical protein EAF00_007032 [Botryotinia globosa]